MTKEEYRLKISELIEVGLVAGRNRSLPCPLNGTVGIGNIMPFVGLVADMAMNWESDTEGEKINRMINNYKQYQ